MNHHNHARAAAAAAGANPVAVPQVRYLLFVCKSIWMRRQLLFKQFPGVYEWLFGILCINNSKFTIKNKYHQNTWLGSSVVERLPNGCKFCGSSLYHGILLWRWALHLHLAPTAHISIVLLRLTEVADQPICALAQFGVHRKVFKKIVCGHATLKIWIDWSLYKTNSLIISYVTAFVAIYSTTTGQRV